MQDASFHLAADDGGQDFRAEGALPASAPSAAVKAIKYSCRAGIPLIEAVTIEKETPSCIWIRGWTFEGGRRSGVPRKTNKRGQYENYFDTWAEAHQFLLQNAGRELNSARRALERAQGLHGNVKGMKSPTGEQA